MIKKDRYKAGKFKWHRLQTSLIRIVYNLTIISVFAGLVWYGYLLFTTQTVHPLIGSVIFILSITAWILLIIFLRRRYRRVKPSFKLTTFSVIATLVILTFAGVQPISMYKNNLVNEWKAHQTAQEAEKAKKVAEAIAMTPMLIKEAPPQTETESHSAVTQTLKIEEVERVAFELINAARETAGVPPTEWSDGLYELSKKHTKEMADRKQLFHTPMGGEIGENAWGGAGYYHYQYEELAKVIVDSWLSSPLHHAWLLHTPIKESVVSIVATPDGQYASWTFWMAEVEEGPALVLEISNRWMAETGGSIPWLTWLKMKGYLD